MALSEKLRSSIFRSLSPIIGEEEIAAVLSYFPSRDVDEPATKDHVQLETAVLRAEMADLRSELHTGLAELRADLDTGLAELRADLNTGLAGLRADLETGLAGVRAEQAASNAQIHQTLNRMFVALVTLQLTIAGVALALSKI